MNHVVSDFSVFISQENDLSENKLNFHDTALTYLPFITYLLLCRQIPGGLYKIKHQKAIVKLIHKKLSDIPQC